MFKKLLLAAGLFGALNAAANVVIVGTRIVYPADQKSINIQMQNTGDSPSLIQAWVDEGDPDMTPNKTKAPFLVTPPMIRVEGKSGQTLRLMYTGKGLPQDRESVFYFNVLDVPPKPKAEDLGGAQNYLQFAIRNRLKLFYRPTGLKMGIYDAYKKIEWKLLGNDRVEINNPSPYFITFNTVKVANKASSEIEMIAPFGKTTVRIPSVKKNDKVMWQIITDHGGISEGETSVK